MQPTKLKQRKRWELEREVVVSTGFLEQNATKDALRNICN